LAIFYSLHEKGKKYFILKQGKCVILLLERIKNILFLTLLLIVPTTGVFSEILPYLKDSM
jgi:hypothetical protein